ncbi:MAG: helix-turn-helix transcriptional regulator [Clostridia bacterium]
MQDIFIKRLIELMEEEDLSQVALAEKIGTTNVTISRYISGQRKPRTEIVAKIASVFGTSIDYLLGFSSVRNYTNRKVNENLLSLQEEFEKLDLVDSKKELSNSQIEIIKKLIEANKDFIVQAKERKEA